MNNYAGLTTATIPATVSYNGNIYRVTCIGDGAFQWCSTLTSFTIPNSVTSIGYDAFSLCPSLFSINIPNTVTSISPNAFYSIPNVVYNGTATGSPWGACGVNGYIEGDLVYKDNTKQWLNACNRTATGDITIPNGVTGIQYFAFARCSGITSVTIPNTVTSISNYAFYGCSGLTAITIPSSVTSIGAYVFTECKGLTSMVVESGNTVYDSRENCNAIINTATNSLLYGCKTTVIPNSVTSIGNRAFRGHSTLTDISIPNSITSIGEYAFANCTGLTAITIPNSVTRIGWDAFDGCTGLISVTLPNSITTIEGYTFRGCTGLLSVTIPNSVTTIVYDAFDGCTSLASVTIGNSVTSIGDYAFYDCSSLTSLYMLPNTPPTLGDLVFYNVPTDISVYVPCGTMAAYQAATTWSDFTNYKVLSVSAKRQLAPTIPLSSRLSPTPTIGSNNGTTAIPTTRVPLRSMTTFLLWRNLNQLRPLSIVFPNHSRTNSLKSSFVRVVCTSNEVSPSIPLPVFNSVRA